MATRPPRKSYPIEQKLAWGKQIIEEGLTRKEAAEKFHLAESQVDTYKKMHLYVTGQTDTVGANLAASTRVVKALQKLRKKHTGVAVQPVNGNAVPMPTSSEPILRARVIELEDELQHAHHQIDILQKIVMTLGEKL